MRSPRKLPRACMAASLMMRIGLPSDFSRSPRVHPEPRCFGSLMRYLAELPLRLSARFRTFRFQASVDAIRLQLTRLHAIVQNCWDHVIDDLNAQCGRLDWERHFDPPEKIARHPIRARKVNQ